MRARIIYTVEVDEIPSEVERLKIKVEKLLSSSLSMVKSADIGQSVDKSLEKFEEASKNLVTIDLLLRDSCAILEGYLLSKLGPESQHSTAGDPGDPAEPGNENR